MHGRAGLDLPGRSFCSRRNHQNRPGAVSRTHPIYADAAGAEEKDITNRIWP
jgi:hypothetical protein